MLIPYFSICNAPAFALLFPQQAHRFRPQQEGYVAEFL